MILKTTSSKASKYKGVFWCARKKKWFMRLLLDDRVIEAYVNGSEHCTAVIADHYMQKYFGEHSNLNFPELGAVGRNLLYSEIKKKYGYSKKEIPLKSA